MEIDVTGADLRTLVKAAYELSAPQGLGYLHFKPGGLTDEEADSFIEDGNVYMDYVRGRACKFSVWCKEGKLTILYPWYDHTRDQFAELLQRVGMEDRMPAREEHASACNCETCVDKRAYRKINL